MGQSKIDDVIDAEVVPDDVGKAPPIEDETALQKQVQPVTLDSVARQQELGKAIIEAKTEILDMASAAAIKRTEPQDWILFKAKDGSEKAMLGNAGCRRVAPVYGIRIYNLRGPDNKPVAQPALTVNEDKTKSAVLIVDGVSAFTGMKIEGVRAERNSGESFVGRNTDSDLLSACRTLADSKVIRALTETASVPVDVLKRHGMSVDKCQKGSGYGTSAERGAASVAEEGVPELAAKLRDEVLRCVGGDATAAKDLLKEITGNPPKFAGFTSVSRMTKKWQVENAMEKLKKHPTFGDEENIE